MASREPKSEFWNTLIRAVEAEPLAARPLRGASGFLHPVTALGYDSRRARLIVISEESEARTTALAQADIQAASPPVRVIIARSVWANLATLAKSISDELGTSVLSPGELDRVFPKDANGTRQEGPVKDLLEPLLQPLDFSALNFSAAVKQIIDQFAHVEFTRENENLPSSLDLRQLIAFDPTEGDRKMGVCSIPLYDFSEPQVETFHSGKDLDQVREILRGHHILQYFFPAADHLALGLAEQEEANAPSLLGQMGDVPSIGHPFGPLEIVSAQTRIPEVIDELRDRGLLVEGERTIEVTPEGERVREQVRFKPREGLISKLIRRFRVNIDLSLRDLLGS